MQFPAAELTGRHADMSEEAAAEMAVAHADLQRDLGDRKVGLAQQRLRAPKATFRDEGKG
jgi:hypothetical protein